MAFLWLNGTLLPPDHARIDPADRGFALGDGVFETVLVRQGQPAHWAAHWARLVEGAGVLGIPVPFTEGRVVQAMAETLAGNGLADAVLRLTLTRGPGPRGLAPPARPLPTLMISAGPAPEDNPGPLRAVIATVTRRNAHSPLCRIKSLNGLDNILARQEAMARDADEAILLNGRGTVAETAMANLFAVIGGTLVTPPLADGALPGTLRQHILDHEPEAREQSLTPADLHNASELLSTNALGLRPITRLDHRPVGNGTPGPVTCGLVARRYQDKR